MYHFVCTDGHDGLVVGGEAERLHLALVACVLHQLWGEHSSVSTPPPQDVTHLAQSYGWEGIVQNWGRTCAYDWLAKAKSPGSCAAPLRLRHGNSYFPPSTDERWGIAIDIVSIFRSLTLLASADRAFRFAGFH